MATERIELHKDNFQPQTLGFEVFPDILEGRKRPPGIFDQPFTYLLGRMPTAIQTGLRKQDIQTFSDLLNIPVDQLQAEVRGWELVRYRVHSCLAGFLAIGAEGYFLARVFNDRENAIPIPLKFEEERNRVLREILNSLGIIESRGLTVRDILERHFGIADGRTRHLDLLSKELDLTRERVRNIEQDAFRRLRHPSRSTYLSLYAPLPQDSLGKALWNVDFTCQIQRQLFPLALTVLRPQDIYQVEYLRDEFPSQMAGWDKVSSTPLPLLLKEPARDLPKVLFDLKDRLEVLRR